MITAFSDTELEESSIKGVVFKELITHADDRGFFRELVRGTDDFFKDGFGQWSHSRMAVNTVKAWHYHHLQIDWWYVPFGVVHTVLFDNREESPTFKKKIEFKLGESSLDSEALSVVVKIPQGVLHGCKVLSDSADLFYITSRTYDPQDEGRFPFNSDVVGQNWGAEQELTVAANDRRAHVPPFDRVQA